MLNFNFDIAIEKDNLKNNYSQNSYNEDKGTFSKVFEDANKSFEATKEKIAEKEPKEEGFFQKIKNKLAEKKEQAEEKQPSTELSQEKEPEKSSETVENPHLNSAENASALEQILLNYKNTLTQNLPQESEENVQTQQVMRETGEKLLHQREQARELTAKFMNEMKNIHSKAVTQNPIKTQAQQALATTSQTQEQQTNSVLLSNNAVLNLQNLQNLTNQKIDGNNTLADAVADLKVEVTSVKTDVQAETKGFDFNSSTFSNLDSHITKLSLNKGVDFSKVMSQKIPQDQQILNQVREATSSQLTKGTSEVNIILKPESLGRINVHISSANGAVTAQFTAQSQQAADALSKNIETLRQNLLEQGVKVSEVTVKVQSSAQGEALADNRNFGQETFSGSKENYSSNKNTYNSEMNSDKNGHNNSNKEENNNLNNNKIIQEKEEEILTPSMKKENNDLGIYNNKGRKV